MSVNKLLLSDLMERERERYMYHHSIVLNVSAINGVTITLFDQTEQFPLNDYCPALLESNGQAQGE